MSTLLTSLKPPPEHLRPKENTEFKPFYRISEAVERIVSEGGHITQGAIKYACQEQQIVGARKIGGLWFVPGAYVKKLVKDFKDLSTVSTK